jgi:hypothetical protein
MLWKLEGTCTTARRSERLARADADAYAAEHGLPFIPQVRQWSEVRLECIGS